MRNLTTCVFLAAASLFPGSFHMAGAETNQTVEQWGVYEIILKGPTNGNPFVDVRLSAVFDNGARQVEAEGFYDGGDAYRIRLMPESQGPWRYETKANRWELTGKTGTFQVTAPERGNHGPVRVHNTYHFA